MSSPFFNVLLEVGTIWWEKLKGNKMHERDYLIYLLDQMKHADVFWDPMLIAGSEVFPAAQRSCVWEAMTNLVKQPSALEEYMKCYTKSFLHQIPVQQWLIWVDDEYSMSLSFKFLSLATCTAFWTEPWQIHRTSGLDYKCFVSHQYIKTYIKLAG